MSSDSTVNIVYSGTFERSIDAKNRLTVPSKWLTTKGDEEFHVIPNPNPADPFLIVMPPNEFAQMEARILATDAPAAEKRKAIRQFYGAAQSVTIDKQGRVLLPEDHCGKLQLRGEVVLVGSKSRFEIWSKSRWETAINEDTPVYQKVAELIGL